MQEGAMLFSAYARANSRWIENPRTGFFRVEGRNGPARYPGDSAGARRGPRGRKPGVADLRQEQDCGLRRIGHGELAARATGWCVDRVPAAASAGLERGG